MKNRAVLMVGGVYLVKKQHILVKRTSSCVMIQDRSYLRTDYGNFGRLQKQKDHRRKGGGVENTIYYFKTLVNMCWEVVHFIHRVLWYVVTWLISSFYV